MKPSEESMMLRGKILDVLRLYGSRLDAIEVLATLSYTVGQCLAMQDSRSVTIDQAMLIILKNIEAGNMQVVEELNNTKGSC